MARNSKVQSEMQLLISLVKKIDQTNDVLRELKKVEKGTARVGKESQEASKHVKALGVGLQQGIGLGAGLLSAQAALKMTQFLKQAVALGVQWNSQIEQTQIALTTLLGDADAAQTRIDELIDFAAFTPFELPEIIQVNRLLENMTKGALSSAEGMNLVGDAAAAAGTDLQSTAFWMGRLYAGLSTGTPVGEASLRLVELGLITGDLKIELDNLAKSAQGEERTMEILRGAFSKTSGAMELQSRTLKGLRSTLNDVLGKKAGDTFRGFFDGLKDALEGSLIAMGALDSVTGAYLHKLKQIPENAKKIAIEAQSSGGDARSLTALTQKKYEDLKDEQVYLMQLLQKVQEANREFNVQGAGMGLLAGQETQRAQADREALINEINNRLGSAAVDLKDKALVTSLKDLVGDYSEVLRSIREEVELSKLEFPEIANETDLAKLHERAIQIQSSSLPATNSPLIGSYQAVVRELDVIAARVKEIESFNAEIEKNADNVTAELKLQKQTLASQLTELDEKIKKTKSEGQLKLDMADSEENRQRAAEANELALLKLFKERAALLLKIEKQDKELQEKKLKAVQDAVELQMQKLQDERAEKAAERSSLESDWTRADFEKHEELIELYEEELLAIEMLIAGFKQAQSLTEDEGAKAVYGEQIADLQSDRQGIQSKTTGADPNAFGDQAIESLTALRNEWGSIEQMFGEGVSSVLQSSVDSLSESIEGLMDGTMTWGESLTNIWVGFRDAMVKAFADMVAKWMVSKAAMFAVEAMYAARSLALSLANAAKSLLAWIPAAIAAVISNGWAGLALAAAAVVGVMAATGSFAEGGYTGDGGKYEPAGTVHKGEIVWSQADIQAHGGVAAVEALRVNRSLPQYSAGGYVSAASTGSSAVAGTSGNASPQVSIAIRTSQDDGVLRDWLQSREGKKVLLDASKDNQFEV